MSREIQLLKSYKYEVILKPLTEAERQEFVIKTQLQTASSLEITQGTCINFCHYEHWLLKLNISLPSLVKERWHFHHIDLSPGCVRGEGQNNQGSPALASPWPLCIGSQEAGLRESSRGTTCGTEKEKQDYRGKMGLAVFVGSSKALTMGKFLYLHIPTLGKVVVTELLWLLLKEKTQKPLFKGN